MADDQFCFNCGTKDPKRNIEGDICELCFRNMPMDILVTPGSWEPAEPEEGDYHE